MTFELATDIMEKNSVVVLGRTNLPDGTIVMVSVSGKTTQFMGQSDAQVVDGGFRAGPFGPVGGLKEGLYEVSAGTPLPRFQPPSVRSIIGENGENLKGALVKVDERWGATVSVDKELQIKNSPMQMATADFKSGGIGISRTDWEQVHGKPVLDSSFAVYEKGKYSINWQSWLPVPTADHIELTWTWQNELPVTLETARVESKRLIPADATLVRTYVLDDGTPVDLYISESLKHRIDPRFWFGSQPGTFIVIFELSVRRLPADRAPRIHTIIIATGNNP